MVKCQHSPHGWRGSLLDVCPDVVCHGLERSGKCKMSDEGGLLEGNSAPVLDVDRDHVLEDARPELGAVVRHGTVLHGSSEHHHVPGLTLHLERVVVEVLDVVRVLRHDVRTRSDGGGSVLLTESSQCNI